MLFRTETVNETTLRLSKVSEWNHNYIVTSLVYRNSQLIVGDAISSVSVLHLVNGQLQSIARDYAPLWPVAVEGTGRGEIIGADVSLFCFTYTCRTDCIPLPERLQYLQFRSHKIWKP